MASNKQIDDNYYLSQSIEYINDEYSNEEEDTLEANTDDYLANPATRSSLSRKRKSLQKKLEVNSNNLDSKNSKQIKFDANSEKICADKLEIRSNVHLAFKIDRLCEYAQVLMHCLLYKINYYNKKTHFEKLLKYNIIVYVRNYNY